MAKTVKIEITQKGVFYAMAAGEREQELEVGQTLELEKEPLGWVGKYRVLSSKEGKALETGDAKTDKSAALEELKARYAELGGNEAEENWKAPAYKKAIAALEEKAKGENGNGDNF